MPDEHGLRLEEGEDAAARAVGAGAAVTNPVEAAALEERSDCLVGMLSALARLARWRRRLAVLLAICCLGFALSFIVLDKVERVLSGREDVARAERLALSDRILVEGHVLTSPDLAAQHSDSGRLRREEALGAQDRVARLKARIQASDRESDRLAAVRRRVGNASLPIGFASFAGLFLVALAALGVDVRQRRLVHRLAAAGDPRSIGALAEALVPADAQRRPPLRRLVRLFEVGGAISANPVILKPEQQHQVRRALGRAVDDAVRAGTLELDEPDRAALARALGQAETDKDADFAIAAIRAFAALHDGRVAGIVCGLAEIEPDCPDEERVKAAAQEFLPELARCAEVERHATTLVRPTDAPDGTLLRPAPGVDEEALLRPSDG